MPAMGTPPTHWRSRAHYYSLQEDAAPAGLARVGIEHWADANSGHWM